MESKIPFWEVIKTLIIFIVGFIIVVFVAKSINSLFIEKNENKPMITPIVSCPTDSKSFENTEKKLTLLENRPSNGTEGILKGFRITIERSGITSDIACGYLFYRVSFGDKPIEQEYMSLYMNLSSGQFGGHILPDEKKGAIINEINNKTEVIMPLDRITYNGLERYPIKEVDWVALLNVSNQIEVDIALSADTILGNIDLVQFTYKCVNPETREETEDCKLKVTSIEPVSF